MRRAALAAVVAVLAGHASAATQPAPWTVHCDGVVLRPAGLDRTHRIALGRVAFSGRPVFQVARAGGSGYPYWSKALLFVRPGDSPVVISVPPAWRDRVGITWSSPIVPALRFASCPIPRNLSQDRWNGYVGGLYVREPACVPLILRVRERSTVVRLGIGRACG